MNIQRIANVSAALSLTAVLFSACGGGEGNADGSFTSKRAGINEVIIEESADIDKLNPVTSTSANGQYVQGEIFQAMMDIDPVTFEYNPILAVARPEILPIEEGEYKGGLTITYEIRPEAVWDNGEPITAHDAAFSLKAILNPKVDAEHVRAYYEYIADMSIDPENPKKFTFYCRDRYFMSEIWSSIGVLPEYVYDPNKIMRKFTVKELNDSKNKQKLSGNADIIAFADEFNSEKYQREKGFVVGSGPYEFVEWTTGQRIILKKKANWWGDQLAEKLPFFEANPEKLIFEVITDPTTSVTALKDEGLDVMRGMRSKDFVELRENEDFKKLYKLHSPMALQYSYIGLNMRNPKLQDKKVRQALTRLVNRDLIIETLSYGLATKIVGPIHPSQEYYNKDLPEIPYDPETARQLLAEAGWKDSDGDGVLDKVIEGKKTPMVLTLKIVAGSDTQEKIGLFLQEDAKKVGVKVELEQKEWTVFIDESKAHNFEMFLGGWVSAPTLTDLKQIWHTSSYNGGSNYVGFGNAETDELIEKIRYELDETKRNEMYYRFQEITYEEVPYIFMTSPKEKIAIHARFDNADAVIKRPGYVVDGFRLNPNFGKSAVATAAVN